MFINNIKKLFLALILFLVFKSPVEAFDFIKDSHNPLTINFINDYSKSLQAHIFKKGNQYYGILAAKKNTDNFFSLVLIKSTDGINWLMEKEILRTGSDLSNGRYLESSIGNKLFLTKFDIDGKYRIYLSDCDSNFNCSTNFQSILNIEFGNTTEQNGIFAAFPYQQNNRVYLFYGVWGIDGFKIRLAYSDDWQNWIKCPNQSNIVYGGDGPFIYENNNDLNLFYHRSDSSGIKLATTNLPLSCDSQFEDQGYLLMKGQTYDYQHMFFPSVIDTGSNYLLYYTSRSQTGENRLSRAFTSELTPTQIPTPIPTFTPTPTIIPTIFPTLTNIPTPSTTPAKNPIVIIPGFMASWNKDAILFNKSVDQSQWKMLSFVREYDGMIKTLENLGYVKNKDYFVFNYDWRKPILEIIKDFDLFITDRQQLTANRFNIIGHSLGGLIGRFYQEKFRNNKLDKLITVGSPHKGVAQVYKIIEAGEIDRSNSYFWLSVKIILNLNRNNLEKDKQVINRLFPVLKDLFPVFNFIKKDGVEIPVSEMIVKNEILTNESSKIPLVSLIGEKGPTLKGFNVSEQTITDKLLGIYPDGRPTSSFNDIGDYLVLSSSAKIEPFVSLHLDHGELIYKKEAIKKILDLLYIPYKENQIVEGKGTRLDNALIIFLKSGGKMEVSNKKEKFMDQDGIIIIKNPLQGKYQIKVKGSKKEKDEIIIFKIKKDRENWEKTGRGNTSGQENYYIIHY